MLGSAALGAKHNKANVLKTRDHPQDLGSANRSAKPGHEAAPGRACQMALAASTTRLGPAAVTGQNPLQIDSPIG